MQITIPKVKESRSRCNFFSEMNKIEVAFEKKKRKRKETVKTLGSMWESQKMFTSFHLHENFRLILRIWEKKWYEIILSLPKNAQMPHQIEYWKFQHILAQAVIKLNLSGALFYFFFLLGIYGGAWHKRKYNEHDFYAFDFGTKMILCTNFRCSSCRKLHIWSWISGQKLSPKVPWHEMNKYMNENVYLKKEIANKS